MSKPEKKSLSSEPSLQVLSELSEQLTALILDVNEKLIDLGKAQEFVESEKSSHPAKIIFDNLKLIKNLLLDNDHLKESAIIDEFENLVKKFDESLGSVTHKRQIISNDNKKSLEALKAQWSEFEKSSYEVRESPYLARALQKYIETQKHFEDPDQKKSPVKLSKEQYDVKDKEWKLEKVSKGHARTVGEGLIVEVNELHQTVHLQGLRPSQEDTHDVREIDVEFNERTALRVFSKTNVEVQKKAKEIAYSDREGKGAGSTLSAALLFEEGGVKKVAVSSMGDTRAYVVSSEGGKFKLIPLSRDHRPDSKEEQKMIKAGGGVIINDKVNGDIGITRAIGGGDAFEMISNQDAIERGDKVLGKLSGEPIPVRPKKNPDTRIKGSDIADHTLYDIDQKKDRFILQICDGVLETLSDQHIEVIIADCYSEGRQGEIAESIVQAAYKTGSQDNIGVQILPIDFAIKKPRLAIFADGNGGSKVSALIQSEYGEIFSSIAKEITSKKEAKEKPSSAPQIASSAGVALGGKPSAVLEL